MATHSPTELRRLWGRNELTDEQLLGHLVQHLLILYERLDELERRLRQQEAIRSEPPKPPA